MLQMEKVRPVGVNRLGYKAETSPVFKPLMGRTLARAFTLNMAIKASVLISAFLIRVDIGSERKGNF